ncbi:MAG: ATP cone domain-containing protein [Thermoproteota archaeon]|nr:ATP cone domain-containing protein [Thermoproteota archaeon]
MLSNNQDIEIRKNNGRTEPFDEEKLSRGISRSGTPFAMARDIAKSIYQKVASSDGKSEPVDSSTIRQMVIEELNSRNEKTIAESYSGYSKNNQTEISEEQGANEKYSSTAGQVTPTHEKDRAKLRGFGKRSSRK